MLIRKILLVAVLAVALVGLPTAASAQERGQDRATVATANAHAKGRPTELPPGIAKRVENGGTLPAGIERTRPQPEPEPLPEPEPEQPQTLPEEPQTLPEEPAEECGTYPAFEGGIMVIKDCHGNVVGTYGG